MLISFTKGVLKLKWISKHAILKYNHQLKYDHVTALNIKHMFEYHITGMFQ